MKPSIETLIDELRNSPVMPEQALLYRLSNLEAHDAEHVRDAWPGLPVWLRQQLMTGLVELAEADFEVDFSAIFRLGMKDEDATVRAMAIDGLWEDEDIRLIPALITCLLNDEAHIVRTAAAISLGRFVLLGELEKIRPETQATAYDALLAACQDSEEHPDVQRRAMESLSYVSNETVVALIHKAYTSAEEKLLVSAIFSMGRSADTRWAKQVQQELFSPNPELRYEAARACGELQLAQTVDDLEELTQDVDPEVQEAALWSLGQIGGEKARKILLRFCQSGDEATRDAAEAALNELEFLHGDLTEFFARLVQESDW